MILSCWFLDDVNSVNSFEYIDYIEATSGDAFDIYFQLVDLSKDKSNAKPGRRYVPAASSTLSVVIDHTNASAQITRTASQPFDLDPSIWKISVLSTDAIKGTLSLRLTLTEPIDEDNDKVTRGKVQGGLRISLPTAM